MGDEIASGRTKILDQRSFIKSETLCSRRPTGIHDLLLEVCGD